MNASDTFCEFEGCDRPNFRSTEVPWGRMRLCHAHVKQLQRHGALSPIKPRPTPEQWALESSIALLEADGDEEYERAHRRWLSACLTLGRRQLSIRKQRPPPPYEAALRAALLEGMTVEQAAQAASCSRATAYNWRADHRAELQRETRSSAAEGPAERETAVAP